MPPPTSKVVNELLHKASTLKKSPDNWDADFDCESDTLFRSSVSSESSASSSSSSHLNSTPQLPSTSTFTSIRASHKSTADFLDSFREIDEGENDIEPTRQLSGKFNRMSLNNNNSKSKVQLRNRDNNDFLNNFEEGSFPNDHHATIKSALQDGIPLPRNVSPSAFAGGTIRRLGSKPRKQVLPDTEDWSEEFSVSPEALSTPKPLKQQPTFDSDDFIYNDETLATIKAKQPTQSKLARNNSLIQGTFFDPPSQLTSPTKYRSLRRKAPESQPMFDEEDFADGFEGDAFGKVNLAPLQKFKTQHIGLATEEEDIDKIWGDESVGGLTGGSSLHESGNSSIFSSSTASNTESEVEGEDFLEGLVFPEDEMLDFDGILKRNQQEAKERERLEIMDTQASREDGKFDSIGSNDSGHLLIDHRAGANDEMDFLDGFELGGEELLKGETLGTLHRNVKIKSQDDKNGGRNPSPSKLRKRVGFGNVPDLAHQSSSTSKGFNKMGNVQPPSTIRMEKLRTKKSMPALRSQNSTLPASSNDAIEMAKTRRNERKHQLSQLSECNESPSLSGSPKKRGRIVSSGVRSVQSLSNLRDPEEIRTRRPSPTKRRSQFSKARTGKIIGDGTELDSFDDLPTNATQEMSFTARPTSGKTIKQHAPPTISRKPLEAYMEKPVKDTLKKLRSPAYKSAHKRNKTGAKLGLIQQLGPPVSTVVKGYSGNMHFNVKTYTWEGNNEDLKRFDNTNAKTPGLIAYISTKGIQIVGDMVFDPAKMTWINLNEDAAEDDPFDGVDDLDVTIKGGHGVALHFSHNNASGADIVHDPSFYRGGMRNYTDTTTSTVSIISNNSKRSSATTGNSSMQNTDEYAVGKEFEITIDMMRRFRHEESRWEHKVQGWFPPDEAYNRDYLTEIRTMVMRKA